MPGTNGETSHLSLTREQIAAELEREAARRLHLTALELIQQYKKGELEDPGAVMDLLILASLLPDDDKLFVQLAA